MNRKPVAIVAVAAVVALAAGAAVGRSLITSEAAPAPRADVVRFKDEVLKVSIAYPASWTRVPTNPNEPDISLIARGPESSALSIRVTNAGLAPVSRQTLSIFRKFTDSLIAEDPSAKQLVKPAPVELGGLIGYRYRYTYGAGEARGAHDHYFLVQDGRVIQLVFEAVPPGRLAELTPTFRRIASTFRGESP